MSAWGAFANAIKDAGAAGADVFDRLRGAVGGGEDARQAAFSMAVVALAAKMAKADGVVTMAETASFWSRFDVPPDAIRPIHRLFDLAQKDVAGFEAYARKIARLFPDDDVLREDILDILYSIAATRMRNASSASCRTPSAAASCMRRKTHSSFASRRSLRLTASG